MRGLYARRGLLEGPRGHVSQFVASCFLVTYRIHAVNLQLEIQPKEWSHHKERGAAHRLEGRGIRACSQLEPVCMCQVVRCGHWSCTAGRLPPIYPCHPCERAEDRSAIPSCTVPSCIGLPFRRFSHPAVGCAGNASLWPPLPLGCWLPACAHPGTCIMHPPGPGLSSFSGRPSSSPVPIGIRSLVIGTLQKYQRSSSPHGGS